MFQNYLKTTLRNLRKKRTYSFLNIAGLAIGLACASMIFLWVEDELTFNHNFTKRDNLYQIYENQTYEGKTSTFHATPGPMAAAMKKEIPGLVNAARSGGTGPVLFALGDKSINEAGDYVDSALLSMLDLPFVHGSPAGAFLQQHSLVINETMAKKFFGATNPLGKTLRVNNEQDYTITGVFKDLPKNSTFQFHWLAPIANIELLQPWQSSWGANWARTYVELRPSANPALVNHQLEKFISVQQKQEGGNTTCFLFAMNDWNLRDGFTDGKQAGGRIQYVKLFSLIAWIILLIACINFMNLSTARSEQRAKEVGVRKVMGAGRGKLIGQFIGEALVMSVIAVLLAITLVYLVLPYFNTVVEKELHAGVLSPLHLSYLVAISIVTGLVAGSYPAFYLSSFNPVAVLKGLRVKGSAGNSFIRKSLVVAQFSISIVLIIGTTIIYRQIQHVKNRELGYNKNNLLYIEFQNKLDQHFDRVYNNLKNTGVVADAALSDFPVTQIWRNTDNYSWKGKDPSKNPLITWEDVDAHFLSTMGMKLIAGRDFHTNASADSNKVIINESFAAAMGKEGRIGGIILGGGKKPLEIVGIVRDFLYNTMYESAAPLLLNNHPPETRDLSIRLKPEAHLQDAVLSIEKVLKADSPEYPVDLKFIDEDFALMFKTETLTGKLAGMFAALAIVISCLGLFGLAAYTAERRIKEIGIRKVLGASTAGLVGLLSRQFLQLVAIACLIAFPVAWWALHSWLQNYAYHTAIHWYIFLAAGAAALLIALITVSFQAIRAAVASPIKSLRTE
jgi:predicted permease